MKKRAFTLAEILITLGIIGVVSALTIPTLVKRNTNETHVEQLKKVYATLSEAAETAMQENNVNDLSETELGDKTGNNGPKNFLNKYFKVSIDCDTKMTPCFADTYKGMDGNPNTLLGENYNWGYSNSVSLADGTAICLQARMDTRSEWGWDANSDYHTYVSVFVDVNGPKGPNIFGRDFFTFYLFSDGKIGESYSMQVNHANDSRTACIDGSANSYGGGCFTTIMLDGWKMDY